MATSALLETGLGKEIVVLYNTIHMHRNLLEMASCALDWHLTTPVFWLQPTFAGASFLPWEIQAVHLDTRPVEPFGETV